MFSIVIANWNGAEILEKCLESLRFQTYKDFNIYIVDNGSMDSSFEVIHKFSDELSIDLTKLPTNQGFAIANNIGIDKCLSDANEYVLTLNNDIELPKDCLSNLSKFINTHTQYDVFQMTMINYFDRDVVDALGICMDTNHYPSQIGYKQPISVLSNQAEDDIFGACAGAAVYSKAALRVVRNSNGDFFDSNFFAYYEDIDLCLRLRAYNFSCALVKDAIVYHMHSATSKKDSPFKEYYLTRNLFLNAYKNFDGEAFSKIKKSYYKGLLKQSIKHLINFRFKNIVSMFKGLKDFNKMKGAYDK